MISTYIKIDNWLLSIAFEEFYVDCNDAVIEKACIHINGIILWKNTQMAIGCACLED